MSVGNGSSIESEKYHVIRELGRGGMGVVYLAEDRQLRRQVALKVLYDYLNRDQAFVARFQEEARSVSTLHHPNIVCVHGLERAGDTVAIDMELVEGVSLDQIHSATPYVGAAIARDVLGGLAACHQIGVVHRDIKPSNILLNQAGQAKITDFGLATAYASHMESTLQGGSSSGFYMGTPRYMPMQAWEGGNPEPIWDLYSFGVVLHEVLSGQPAFKGENPASVMRKQLTESLPPLHSIIPQLSPEFSELVEALLNACKPGNELTCAEAFDLLRNTPEFKALQESDTASTLPMKSMVKKRAKRPRKHITLPRAFWVASTLLAASFGVIYGYRLIPSAPVTPVSPDGLPLPAAAVRSGELFYEAQLMDGDERCSWMVQTDVNAYPVRITGMSSRSMWVLQVTNPAASGRMNVEGGWAARFYPDSASTEYGTFRGSLNWEPDRDQPVLTLTRKRSTDQVAGSQTFVAHRKDGPLDRAGFFRRLEGNDVLMSLLYAELLRRPLDWAAKLEEELPALQDARMNVPRISEAITLDGDIAESTWVDGAFDDYGPIGEFKAQGGKLMVRWDDQAVYLAATCPNPDATLEIAVAPGVARVPSESGRYVVSISPPGNVEGKYFQGDRQRPWSFDWHVAVNTDSGETRVEIAIPASRFADFAKPVVGRRWRINASFVAPGAAAPTIVWGAPSIREVEHGALLVFQASESSR